MIRHALAALLAAAPCFVSAQALTRPAVTVSAGYFRAADVYDMAGSTEGDNATLSALSVGIGAEVPVLRRSGLTASAGARLSLASYRLDLGGTGASTSGGDIHPQNLVLYGRVGDRQASALLGVSLDLGTGFFDEADEFRVNSDGQNAVVAQVRGETRSGRTRLFAQADAAVTLAEDDEILFNSVEDPVGVPYPISFDSGDPYGVQVGAVVPVGPVELGLAAFYAGRTSGSYTYTEGVPVVEGFPDIEPTQTFQFGYDSAFGLVPSVVYRAPSDPVVVRLDGSFSELYSMEGVPVGLTVGGESGPEMRPAVTLSVGVGL